MSFTWLIVMIIHNVWQSTVHNYSTLTYYCMCTYDVYTLNRAVDNSRERFGDKTDRRQTLPWYKISVYPFVNWLTLNVWLTTRYLLLRLGYVVCKMLLCIGSLLTDCICAASHIDTIAGLLKSDFRRRLAIFLIAHWLRYNANF